MDGLNAVDGLSASDGLNALVVANAEFERRLRAVGAADWGRPTPCDEWDVRALVNHVIGANRRHAMLLAGASAAEVDAIRSDDHLGGDALASFLTTASALLAAFGAGDAMDRVVHHPVGDRTGAELLRMRVLDVAVHTWDLARAVGVDEILDPDLVALCLTFTPPLDPESTEGRSPQHELLHRTGRRPLTTQETP